MTVAVCVPTPSPWKITDPEHGLADPKSSEQRTRLAFVLQAIVAEVEVDLEGTEVNERAMRDPFCLPYVVTSRVVRLRTSEDAKAPAVGSETRSRATETRRVVTMPRRSAKGFGVMLDPSAKWPRQKAQKGGSTPLQKAIVRPPIKDDARRVVWPKFADEQEQVRSKRSTPGYEAAIPSRIAVSASCLV